jgi:hypothetical protein
VILNSVDELRSGTSTPQKSRALAALAKGINDSVSIEIQLNKYIADAQRIGAKAIKLGDLRLS